MGPGSDPDDETVDPGPGRDRIFGGKGRDDFCGSKLTSGDTYDGGPGPDQFCVDGRGPSNATIKGGPDRDGFFQRGKLPVTIALNDLADDDFGCANGCDGNNLGSDIELLRIEAPAGSLSGGPGDDRISVSDDSDDSDDSEGDEGAEGDGGFRFRLFGLEGNDRLIADLGPAWIDGGPGNDRIEGSDRGDSLFGAAGDDWLFGFAGADFLNGGEGSDTCDGGAEIDEAAECETLVSVP